MILRLLLLLTNLHLKLLSTQGTGVDNLLSTQRVNSIHGTCTAPWWQFHYATIYTIKGNPKLTVS